MRRHHRSVLLCLALLGSPATLHAQSRLAVPAPAQSELSIPHHKYTLKNGLVVILSEDRSLPTVTVSVMVKVGSRFELSGRTGFAHLFEHLMFMGTERVPTGQFDNLMEAEGGWNNAWTSEDRTHYYDVGPSHTLPLLLWLEADRLGSLSDTMSQAKLDAQRGVVKNERRQRIENKPYGKVELRLPELLFPKDHPYHHPVIGSHADLEAASVEDVKRFFGDHYVPRNMALTIVGDFDENELRPRIEKLFGGLVDRAVPPAPVATPVTLSSVVRETIEDEVKLSKIIMAWHTPKHFTAEDAALDVLGSVLVRGKTSRLYKSLVFDKELTQNVAASQVSQELSSYFEIEALLRPEAKLGEVETVIDQVLREVSEKGVSEVEVLRAKNEYETNFVRRLESVHNRASTLASYETYFGDPGAINQDLARYRAVTAADVQAVAKKYLEPGRRVIIHVVPKAKPAVAAGSDKAGVQ